jgi:flagellar basal-body rod protein FlgB
MALNSFLGLLADKMDYLTQRQGVIAKNISSANIAGEKPKDLESFDSILQKKISGGAATATMHLTNTRHLSGTAGGNSGYKTNTQRDLYEVKPSGNAISVEQELMKMGQTNQDYATITGLYKKILGMMKVASGIKG